MPRDICDRSDGRHNSRARLLQMPLFLTDSCLHDISPVVINYTRYHQPERLWRCVMKGRACCCTTVLVGRTLQRLSAFIAIAYQIFISSL